MRYLLLITGSEDEWAAIPPEDGRRAAHAVARWEGEHRAAGRILAGDELAPTRSATTVRRDGADVVVTDGTFLEAKKSIGGYYLIEVADLDAAISLVRSSPFLEIADIEIRPLIAASRLEGAPAG